MSYETFDSFESPESLLLSAFGDAGGACAVASPNRVTVAWASPLENDDRSGLLQSLQGSRRVDLIDEIHVVDVDLGIDAIQLVDAASVFEVATTPRNTIECAYAASSVDVSRVKELTELTKSYEVAIWYDEIHGRLDEAASAFVQQPTVNIPSPRFASCVCDVGTTTLKVRTWVDGGGPCLLMHGSPAVLWIVVDNARVKPEWIQVTLKGLTSPPTTGTLVALGQSRTPGPPSQFQSPGTTGPYNAQFDGYKAQIYPAPAGPVTPAIMRSATGQVVVR
jgi:hypothetical protein